MQADAQLRNNAVQSYLALLDLPKISEVLLKARAVSEFVVHRVPSTFHTHSHVHTNLFHHFYPMEFRGTFCTGDFLGAR